MYCKSPLDTRIPPTTRSTPARSFATLPLRPWHITDRGALKLHCSSIMFLFNAHCHSTVSPEADETPLAAADERVFAVALITEALDGFGGVCNCKNTTKLSSVRGRLWSSEVGCCVRGSVVVCGGVPRGRSLSPPTITHECRYRSSSTVMAKWTQESDRIRTIASRSRAAALSERSSTHGY